MSTLDRTFLLGTEVAGFCLFHPSDLAHRLNSPLGWYGYDFACRKEFEVGRLVTFSTGGDGGFKIRITDGELTEREQQFHKGSWDFRLQVNHGRVLLDNGDCLPSEEAHDAPAEEDERWICVPNGKYRATVHVIDGTEQPEEVKLDGFTRTSEDAFPEYVIRLRLIDDWKETKILSDSQPLLTPKLLTSSSTHDPETFEEKGPLRPVPLILLETPYWQIVPGFYGHAPNLADCVTNEMYDNDIVLAPQNVELGDFATLVRYAGQCLFHSRRLVMVMDRFQEGNWTKVTVEANRRERSIVDPAELVALKSEFLAYSMKNKAYRKNVRYPDFDAERVQVMARPEGISTFLIHHIQMPDKRRLELLLHSDVERVRQLRELLAEALDSSSPQFDDDLSQP